MTFIWNDIYDIMSSTFRKEWPLDKLLNHNLLLTISPLKYMNLKKIKVEFTR